MEPEERGNNTICEICNNHFVEKLNTINVCIDCKAKANHQFQCPLAHDNILIQQLSSSLPKEQTDAQNLKNHIKLLIVTKEQKFSDQLRIEAEISHLKVEYVMKRVPVIAARIAQLERDLKIALEAASSIEKQIFTEHEHLNEMLATEDWGKSMQRSLPKRYLWKKGEMRPVKKERRSLEPAMKTIIYQQPSNPFNSS